jgi:hypothetical protein
MPKLDLHCPFCPKTSSRGTGLASHIRGAHPKEYPGWTKNRGIVLKPKVFSAAPAAAGGGLDTIVALLEKQRAVIEGALTALRQLGGSGPATAAPTVAKRGRKAKRKGGMTPEGKARLIAALKKRWAEKKAGAK